MKTSLTTMTLAVALALTGCGGAGNSSNSATNTSAPEPAPVAATIPLDPTFGPDVLADPANQAAPTTSVSGTVYASNVTGSVVTAYHVNADGSNGALLGTATATGADGKFSMALSSAPTGMVRLVASGGTFVSEADGTHQAIDTMELVAPYVNVNLNSFAITPVTHMASHFIASHAGRPGWNLHNAYLGAMYQLSRLSGTNLPLNDDPRRSINLVATVPNSVADTGHAYQDLITGLEWFGVMYDLPSKVVFRITSASAEAAFLHDGVNAAGTPINVGTWVGKVFDETQPVTLDQLLQGPIATPMAPVLHDDFYTVLDLTLIRDVYFDLGCRGPGQRPDILRRYPSLTGIDWSPGYYTFCGAVSRRIAALQAAALSNHRGTLTK